MTKRFVIIDGKSVFYRGYYAMPNLSTADGTPTGGVYGFAALSLELIRKLKPDYVCVAWDKPKTNIRKRLEIFPEYKAGRKPAPDDFYAQIPILHELLEAFGWPLYELDDYEADDIMATLARKASAEGIETCLITSDLDALQAIDKNTHVYALKKGLTNIDLFNPESFEEKYGIQVAQFLDLKALKGDSSDNIPGVAGVGEKTAVQLLQQFDTLENIYENLWQVKDSVRRKLETGKESAEMSKKVATLFFDAPVELDLDATDAKKLDTAKLKEILLRLEFRSLISRLPDHMRQLEDADITTAYTPAQEMSLEEARLLLTMSPELVVYLEDDTLWLSPERGKVVKLSVQQARDVLERASIIAHDTKQVLHTLLQAGATTLPHIAHDISQGSFLLNPLRTSRTLADLIGAEEIPDAATAISALWALYEEHKKGFAEHEKIAHVARDIDFPLIPILARMEHHGIKLCTHTLDAMNKKMVQQISAIETEVYSMVGYEFNLASPAQLAEALFTKLQLPTAGIKKGKTGYSTGQKELYKLRGQHPIIEKIEEFREVSKLQNTYVDSLPKLVDDRGYIHTTFNQNTTATGRLSSTDPNLQNIPVRSEAGRAIREAFIPAEGNVFVSADYSQFELRLAAVMSGDEAMIADFNDGIDIHAKTASDVYGISLDEVTKDQRRAAKVINFGVLYGMSPHGLAAAAHMDFMEAKRFIDEYFKVRSKVKEFIDTTITQAKEQGYVETMFGRRRPTPDVQSSNFMVRAGAERAAANMPIQGTEADLMKMAMIAVEEKLLNTALGTQILQIHDSIMIECLRDHAEQVAELLKDTMEHICPELGVKLDVDVHIGKNWREA